MTSLRKIAKKAKRLHIAIVVAEFTKNIADKLLEGCLAEFETQGMHRKNVSIYRVPGSFEVPVVALKCAQKKDIDAVICLGAIIRGETYHFEVVADNCARGVLDVSMKTGKPVIFGILTTNTEEQALSRANNQGDHKGKDAAQAALQMIKLFDKI